MAFRKLASLAVCLLLASPAMPAQQPSTAQPAGSVDQPSATISIDARLVNLPVVVRDKKGALIQTLTKADFALAVDGHTQTIRYFDRDENLPLTLGLLVDVSGSVRNALDEERSASESFLDQTMREPAKGTPDKAFLIQFAHEAELLQDLTSSRSKLREALNLVGTPPRDDPQDSNPDAGNAQSNDSSRGYGHHGGRHGAGGTTLYDAVFLSSDELMQKQQGRKALIVLTDGDDRGSKESLSSAIAAAQRSETVVYAIYFKGEQHGGGGYGGHGGGGGYGAGGRGGNRNGDQHVDGKKILEQITGETGGRIFEVSSKQNFASIYSQISEELRSQYRLGYTPDPTIAAEGYHHVDLILPRQKKLIIQCRDGYYSAR